MNNTLIFIGMDTPKESTEVAYTLDSRDEVSQHYGKIPTTKPALIKLARQTTKQVSQCNPALCLRGRALWLLGLPAPNQPGTLLLRGGTLANP